MSDQNPINKDHVADDPHKLPYASNRGSALVNPADTGKIKGKALKAMYQQTDRQLNQIKEQIELLARQANDIQERVEISEKIYKANIKIDPIMGEDYYLYELEDQSWIISLVAPYEWTKNCPYTYVATIQLLADHTWSIVDSVAKES